MISVLVVLGTDVSSKEIHLISLVDMNAIWWLIYLLFFKIEIVLNHLTQVTTFSMVPFNELFN